MNDALTISSDRLSVTLSPNGARLETLRLDAGSSLVLHADAGQHPNWRSCYPGAIVGPVANRVRAGRFTLDGVCYQMPCNENANTALHSGPDGIDCQNWAVIDQRAACLRFGLTLADGIGGLPGNRSIEAEYSVHGAAMRLEITMTTDRPTPAAFAHHPYWRLGHAEAHRLQINAADYLPVDAHNLPTGQIATVVGTPFDHRTATRPDAHVDHNFCIARHQCTAPAPVATLFGADGLSLRIESTEPGLQVYAGAFLPTLPGTRIKPGAGLALEPQAWPDALNHASFPDNVCTPERPYRQVTVYHIKKDT